MARIITLTVIGGARRERRVRVKAQHFSIGVARENDLVLDVPDVARYHALISTFFGIVCVSDRNTRTGTFLNGRSITRPTQLRDGDVIKLGRSCELRVSMQQPLRERLTSFSRGGGKVSSQVAAITAAVILGLAVILVMAVRTGGGATDDISTVSREHVTPAETAPSPPFSQGVASPLSADETGRGEQVERSERMTPSGKIEADATQVLRRVSRDEFDYSFDEQTIKDITAKVENLSGSSRVQELIKAMHGEVNSIATRARREGVEPGLVILLSLALTDRGNTDDPLATSRAVLPSLKHLHEMFGSSGADGSLIVVAAYAEGQGTARSHPLLERMRHNVKDPLAERNVWFLRHRGVISESTYSLIISFLAHGVVVGNPRAFDIDTDPLPF
jgi:pSer/pThr/pTyr-binding forkhead associated (FHA) protein